MPAQTNPVIFIDDPLTFARRRDIVDPCKNIGQKAM
jgi:hypothetical protein